MNMFLVGVFLIPTCLKSLFPPEPSDQYFKGSYIFFFTINIYASDFFLFAENIREKEKIRSAYIYSRK